MSAKRLLNAKQLADVLNVAQNTVLLWFRKGIIVAEIAEGRVIRFDPERVEADLFARAEDVAIKAKSPRGGYLRADDYRTTKRGKVIVR